MRRWAQVAPDMSDQSLRKKTTLPPQVSRGNTQTVRQRGGTTRYDSTGNRMPGEYNERSQPIGAPQNNNLPMSRQYEPTNFAEALKPRGNPLMSAFPSPIGPGLDGNPIDTKPTPAVATPPTSAVGRVPATVASGVINSGASPLNIRGERAVRTPGAGQAPLSVGADGRLVDSGANAIEVDPRQDRRTSYLPAGDSILPRGSDGGVAIDAKYRVPGSSAVGSVTYGGGPLAATGRLVDETGDRTREFAQTFAPPHLMARVGQSAQPQAESREALIARVKAAIPGPEPLSITTGQPTSPTFAGANIDPANWAKIPTPTTPAPVASTPSMFSVRNFTPGEPKRATVKYGPPTAPPVVRVTSQDVLDAGKKLAGRAVDATRGTSFEGSKLDPVLQRLAGREARPTPPPGVTRPASQVAETPAPQFIPPSVQRAAYDPIRRLMAKFPGPQPTKKATPLRRASSNGSQAQMRFAASAY